MRKFVCAALVAAFALFLSAPVSAAPLEPLATVHTADGKTAKVVARFRAAFQGLIDDFEAAGHRIREIGCYEPTGHDRRSKHKLALACDIDQLDRNVTSQPLPADATQIARRHGLVHGAVWHGRRGPDKGHFEVPTSRLTRRELAFVRGGHARRIRFARQ